MKPILQWTFPKMGLNRQFRCDIIYGTSYQLGFGIIHPWVRQITNQTSIILQETGTGSITDDLISDLALDICEEAGVGADLANIPDDILEWCVSPSWLKTLLQVQRKLKIALHWVLPYDPGLCTDNVYLMKAFRQANYKKKDLRKLNACRKWLRVATVSNIASFDGLRIDPTIWNGERRFNFTPLESRQLERLGRSYWALWRQALRETLLQPTGLQLRVPLRHWCRDKTLEATWVLEEITNRLLERTPRCWNIWIPATRRRLRWSTHHYKQSNLTQSNLPVNG